MTEAELKHRLLRIGGADRAAMDAAKKRQAELAKPPGSLGELENIAVALAGMTGRVKNEPRKTRIYVLAADNGVTAEGVSSAPQSVTLAQSINLTRGLTGASSIAAAFGDELCVVDVGISADYDCPEIQNEKIAYGTKNFAAEPAMTREQAVRGIEIGLSLAEKAARDGVELLGVGEMGIGNTTTSSAVLAAVTGCPVEDVTGRGGGITDSAFLRKKEVIEAALRRYQPKKDDVIGILSAVGGFDLCAMTGLFLGAAEQRLPVVIDGFISVVAALCAKTLCKNAGDYFLSSHRSFERGYRLAADALGLRPYLELGMRLGEGSGCPLAFRVVQAACAAMCHMATFSEAAIHDGYLEPIRKQDSFTVKE